MEEQKLNFFNEKIQQQLILDIKKRKRSKIKAIIKQLHPSEIALFISFLETREEIFYFFFCCTKNLQATILVELPDSSREKFFQYLSPHLIASLIVTLHSDKATELLRDIPIEKLEAVLALLPNRSRMQVTELLKYEDETAGGMMLKEFVAVLGERSVKQAIEEIKKLKTGIKINYLYIVDEEGRYLGYVSLSQLVLAESRQKINQLLETDSKIISNHLDQEEVANHFTNYDLLEAPVVNQRGVLVGIIQVDSVLNVMREEASEDILLLSGISSEESFDTSIWTSFYQRSLWLFINVLTAGLSALVINLFEETLERVLILAMFLPIVLSVGGSAGIQTTVLTIRKLSLNEITPINAMKNFRKELFINLLNALFLNVVVFSMSYIITQNLLLSGLMGIALGMNIVIASFIGSWTPYLLKRLNVDPAIASNIIVTTCTDTIGLFLLFGLSYLFL